MVSTTTTNTLVAKGIYSQNYYVCTSAGVCNPLTMGGGVTKITAGTNITISPSAGTGNVTINSSGSSYNQGQGILICGICAICGSIAMAEQIFQVP